METKNTTATDRRLAEQALQYETALTWTEMKGDIELWSGWGVTTGKREDAAGKISAARTFAAQQISAALADYLDLIRN